MRKVVFSMLVTLDGFIEGLNGEKDWHRYGDEFEAYADGILENSDVLLYGRVAYEENAKHWQAVAANPSSKKQDVDYAARLNQKPKIVFSTTLDKVEWNARLVNDNIAEEITKLKKQSGNDLVLVAGAGIAQTFMTLGLIDEYHLLVHPVVLGSGKPLFNGIQEKLNLRLIKTEIFKSGVAVLYYQPSAKQ